MLGHRGARHAAPENTLAAFNLAAREGADGVELDVRLDRDGRVIVIHDRTLSRITAGRDDRDVETLGARELDASDVPALADVLAWVDEHDMRVNIELKHDVSDRDALVRGVTWLLARRRSAPEHVILSCFHPGIVRQLAAALPAIPVGWLVHKGQRFARHARGWRLLGAAAVHPEHVLATPALVQRLQRGGALVNVWTVNDAAEARRLSALGVDAIISDKPGEIRAALRA